MHEIAIGDAAQCWWKRVLCDFTAAHCCMVFRTCYFWPQAAGLRCSGKKQLPCSCCGTFMVMDCILRTPFSAGAPMLFGGRRHNRMELNRCRDCFSLF